MCARFPSTVFAAWSCLLVCVLAGAPATAFTQIPATSPDVIPNIGGGDSTPPAIYFSPTTGAVGGQSVALTITYCDNKSLWNGKPFISLNKIDISATLTYTSGGVPNCSAGATSTGTITLREGQQKDTLVAVMLDQALNIGTDTAIYSYTYAPPSPTAAYAVAVTPNGGTSVVPGGGAIAVPFSIRNTSTNIGTQVVSFALSASCTGTAFPSGCSVAPSSTSLPADSGATALVFFVAGASGTSGRIRVLATQSGPPAVSDSGWMTISPSTLTAGALSVDVKSVNARTASDRNLCLSLAAGEGAARECGDLRLVHALPSVRTLDKDRAPVLIYDSQVAHPYPVVEANVTLGSSTMWPDTIAATLTINGIAYPRRWPVAGFPPGTSRHFAVAFDAVGLPSGMYPYTFSVSSIYNATHSQYTSSATDTLLLVNRAPSPFGAGWWVAGVEQLVFVTGDTSSSASKIMWVGGDGSTRLWAKTTNGKWAAPAINRPDTLARVGSTWVRYAQHGTQVVFNTAGQHVSTINRLQHTTAFSYSGALLTKITLPTPAGGSVVKDSLTYSSSLLHTVLSPSPTAGWRTTTVAMTGHHVTSITDPDTSSVSFGYLTTASDSNRASSRTNKLGHATTFAYDALHRLAKDSLDMGSGVPFIVQRFLDADTVQLAAHLPPPPESLYVRVDGPRTDVRDYTSFWRDAYGAPTSIVDAVGDTTRITRGDARWPGLATREQMPNGNVMLATYSSRGNDSTSTDSVPVKGGSPATTRYLFDPKWDYVTRIVHPMNDSVVLTYDASTGNRLSQAPAGDMSRAVTFAYDATTGLLRAIHAPMTTKPDSLYYDHALGNDSMEVTPRGMRSITTRDLVGRITHTKSPIDSGTSPTHFVESDLAYDLLDRDTLTDTYGPQLHYHFPWANGFLNGVTAPAEEQVVRTHYDREGNALSVSRSSSPDPGGIGSVLSQWVYDRANRAVKVIAPDGKVDSTTYDASGNALVLTPRRLGGITSTKPDSVGVVVSQYDAVNRLVQRQISAVRYGAFTDSVVDPIWTLPRYTNGYLIPSDVETFSYDVAGNVVSAVNGSALVSRTYNNDGTLATDTLRIRNYALGDSSQHGYGLQYSYDLDGRRTALRHPHNLAPIVSGTVKDLQTYTYDPITAQLASVTDVLGNVFRYTYDLKGRLDTLGAPGGSLEYRRYDADDDLVFRVDSATAFVGQPGGAAQAYIHRDTVIYDGRGKVIEARTEGDTVRNGYSAIGSLVDAATIAGDTVGHPVVLGGNEEAFVNDALGNRMWSWSAGLHTVTGSDSATTDRASLFAAGTGRLEAIQHVETGPPGTPFYGMQSYYDAAGNKFAASEVSGSSTFLHEVDVLLYDALNRLRVLDKRTCNGQASGSRTVCQFSDPPAAPDLGYFEEYRYDALGRRILVRSRSDSTCPAASNECVSSIQRTVYDGNQVLYEIQMPGADSVTAAQLERDTTPILTLHRLFGRVVYTQGSAIDRPLDVIRIGYDAQWPAPVAIVPHAGWNGSYDVGTFDDGREKRCTNYAVDTTCVQVDWPAPHDAVFFDYPLRNQNLPVAWTGSLLGDRRDPEGQIYLRNRYYDPASGRFTQEDPIGLAGGLNSYGFANGDPITYSDPFGLCPWCEGLEEMFQDDGPEIEASVQEAGASVQESLVADKESAKAAMQEVRDLGKAGENAVSRQLGDLSKNTEKVNGRIPDFWDKARNTIVEVKNTARLSYTRQLREMVQGAKDLKQKFELFIRPGTENSLSGELLKAIRAGDISIRQIQF